MWDSNDFVISSKGIFGDALGGKGGCDACCTGGDDNNLTQKSVNVG